MIHGGDNEGGGREEREMKHGCPLFVLGERATGPAIVPPCGDHGLRFSHRMIADAEIKIKAPLRIT